MKYILGVLIVLFASYSDIFLFRVSVVPVEPSRFLIPLFIALGFIKYPLNELLDVLKSHTFKFFGFITLMSIIYAAFSKAGEMVIITELSLNFITLFMYVVAVQFFRKEDKSLVLMVILGGLFICGGSVLYDFFVGLPNYSMRLAESVRKGGFGENPNQAASGIKFLALAALVHLTNIKFLRNFVIAFMLFSVFMTFSRSGLVSVFFILCFGAINSWSDKFSKSPFQMFQNVFKLFILFIAIYMSLLILAIVIKANFPQFTRGDAGKRLDLLTGQTESSNISEDAVEGGRAILLFQYIEEFKQKPLGLGTGYSTDKKVNGGKLNTHNYYIYLAVNLGFIALLAYLIYVLYNIRLAFKYDQFYYLIFAILFILEGMFTHTVFHERPIVLTIAFFDAQIYKYYREQIQSTGAKMPDLPTPTS